METIRVGKTKQEILRSAGYRYSFDRQVYFHRDSRKAFSVEFIEDHPADELADLIRDARPNPEWRFYFNNKPSPAVERELASVLG